MVTRRTSAGPEIERLIQLLAKLPGLGPRSARRAALHLIKKREQLMKPLSSAMNEAAEKILICQQCGNIDTLEPCAICRDPQRDPSLLVVVEEVADLWALERAGVVNGRYHVLGGALSALDGIGPDQLNLKTLPARIADGVQEVLLALSATIESQTTAHYVTDLMQATGVEVKVSRLAHGVPVGGELDYLDEGTLSLAIKGRLPF
ncbi:MAG: recombination mediator RecR [Pseudomonadota bacterium]